MFFLPGLFQLQAIQMKALILLSHPIILPFFHCIACYSKYGYERLSLRLWASRGVSSWWVTLACIIILGGLELEVREETTALTLDARFSRTNSSHIVRFCSNFSPPYYHGYRRFSSLTFSQSVRCLLPINGWPMPHANKSPRAVTIGAD